MTSSSAEPTCQVTIAAAARHYLRVAAHYAGAPNRSQVQELGGRVWERVRGGWSTDRGPIRFRTSLEMAATGPRRLIRWGADRSVAEPSLEHVSTPVIPGVWVVPDSAAVSQAIRIENECCTGLSAVSCPLHGDCTCPFRGGRP